MPALRHAEDFDPAFGPDTHFSPDPAFGPETDPPLLFEGDPDPNDPASTWDPPGRTVLSTRQEAFCRHYAVSGNAAAAARHAGYSETCARQQGYENLTKPYIQIRLGELRDAAARTARREAAILLGRLEQVWAIAAEARSTHAMLRVISQQARLGGLTGDAGLRLHLWDCEGGPGPIEDTLRRVEAAVEAELAEDETAEDGVAEEGAWVPEAPAPSAARGGSDAGAGDPRAQAGAGAPNKPDHDMPDRDTPDNEAADHDTVVPAGSGPNLTKPDINRHFDRSPARGAGRAERRNFVAPAEAPAADARTLDCALRSE